uniref:Uncharacterized protein n=1 Tax=Rhodopseudomonas palustris (strain BisA53) TaxID=316055 RepID=Q07KR6_RHOP5
MSDIQTGSFIELCLAGNALIDEVDDFVDRWHSAPSATSLRDYLGMSEAEYSLWINDPDVLPYVILSRKEGRPFTQVVNDNYYSSVRLAARPDQQQKLRVLKDWLQRQGHLAE